MKPKDRTGQLYGAYLVLGKAGKDWSVRCTYCGSEYVRNSDVLRSARTRGSKSCQKCYDISARKRHDDDPSKHDAGLIWSEDEGMYGSTKLGLMQHDFYLGRIR